MKRTFGLRMLVVVALVALIVMAFSASALAQTRANNGAGLDFGQHHAAHAQDGMLDGDMNPGMHQGFAGWEEHHTHIE